MKFNKEKNRAFTLIELLAVIIVLAVLALVSVPIISGIIENTKKKALESSLWAVDSSTKNYYSKLVLQDKTTFDERVQFKIQDNVCQIIDGVESLGCLEFESDNIRMGYVSIYSNNSASICIDDGKYFANKSATDSNVELGEGRCESEYNETTRKYLATTEVTTETITSIESDIEILKQEVSNLKNDNTQLKADNNKVKELILNNDTAGLHNSVFRGKDITSYYNDGTLYKRIAGTDGFSRFEDLYVGDYFTTTNGGNTVTWRIAGFDIRLGIGDQGDGLTTHHAVIVPDRILTTANMNDKVNNADTTAGGYHGSKMYSTTLPSVLSTYITPVFGDHVLTFRSVLSSAMDSSRTNRYGQATGASSGWGWYGQKLDLMTESEVFGTISWASSGYDTGTGHTQFPLFNLEPDFIIAKGANGTGGAYYWLQNVTSSSAFADVTHSGASNSNVASGEWGVRPYFLID